MVQYSHCNKQRKRKKVVVAIWAAVGKAALKVLQALAGDKNGRKFLGYVLGITLFLVMTPVIVLYGLFGWMSAGNVSESIRYEAIYDNLPDDVQTRLDENEGQLLQIEAVFAENGLTSGDASVAKLIYLSYLADRNGEENLYQRLADCFLSVNEGSDLLTNISSAFGIEFSDADRNEFNNFLEVNHYDQ